jgi:hypothetical protein
MKLGTIEKLAGAMKEISPIIEKAGFKTIGIIDSSNSSWEFIDIRILPKPEPGSPQEKILDLEL